jgi:Uma2 family endonuclease
MKEEPVRGNITGAEVPCFGPGEGAKLNVAMKQANVKFTYDDYLLLPENKRYEIVEGELLVVPAPYLHHQRILREMGMALSIYAKSHGIGEIFYAPCDVVLSMENIVQPDLLFVANERKGILTAANIQGPPDLVVEILSESTRRRDLEIKRKLYAKYGVREYWIVDPDAATVDVLVWSETGYASVAVYSLTDRLSSPLLSELNLPLSGIFKKE